ncbi:MAG: hypothetical protein H6922_01675 [Pseudomonadaceae bacterium]|nr:hypothetical protein [Pseudomonadaceae bacterium]
MPYSPGRWNGDIVGRTNCYSYAVQFPYEWLHPGSFEQGAPWRFRQRSSAKTGLDYRVYDGLSAALLRDGLVPLPLSLDGELPDVPDGHFLIAAALLPEKDFHFYLKHCDGSWSHKVGHWSVVKRHMSSDPRCYCQADGYPHFAGFYAVSAELVVRRSAEASQDWWRSPTEAETTSPAVAGDVGVGGRG